MQRYQIFLVRGNDLYVEAERVRLTPDTLVFYRVVEDKEEVIAEFYRENVAGWKKALQ